MLHNSSKETSLLDPVPELGTVFTHKRVILEAVYDLLKFLFGDSLALLSVTFHVFGSTKGTKRLPLLFHIFHDLRTNLTLSIECTHCCMPLSQLTAQAHVLSASPRPH